MFCLWFTLRGLNTISCSLIATDKKKDFCRKVSKAVTFIAECERVRQNFSSVFKFCWLQIDTNMGKISLNVKSKKADDVKGLMKHRENSPSPTKTATVVSQHPSPTPKHPLTETKAGCCRRACLFSLGMLVVLILFVSTACLVDYQQGNLATHTSQLPKEVKEFPRQVGKYVVEVLYQTPKDLHRIFNVALNWTRKNDSGPTSKIIIGSQRLAIKDEILLDQTEGELSSLYEEGKDDTVVVDGLEGVAQFFVGILNDVASMFAATTEEELKDSGSQPNVEITNNAIDRKVDEEESSEF